MIIAYINRYIYKIEVKYYIITTFCFVLKGKMECLVMWKGYRREEASWVVERDVTAAALR